jgi:hypothetical protein
MTLIRAGVSVLLAAAVALLLATTPAIAKQDDGRGSGRGQDPAPVGGRGLSAPEIDPVGVASAAALLVGGALLLDARRRSRRKAG